MESGFPRKIVLATHYFASGPAFELETYLRSRTDELIFIAHPLFGDTRTPYCSRYVKGELAERVERRRQPRMLRFFDDVRQTIRWASTDGRFDVFIAGDNLLSLAGLWLRWRRRARSVILYTIDFVPRRFQNVFLNRIYHAIDSFAVRRVDVVWNVSAAIESARRKRDGAITTAPQIVVPLGAHYERIRRRPLAEAYPFRIAFLGVLLEKQGLQIAIEAMPGIRRAVPEATLLILGDGPHASALRALAHRVGVEKAVQFAGYVEDHAWIEEQLARSALAIAPYAPDPLSFTRFADPGKIKTYLACGLPIVLTDVPPIARAVEEKGAGRIIPYDSEALSGAIINYLTHPAELEQARNAAADFGALFAWDRVFADAWAMTLPSLHLAGD